MDDHCTIKFILQISTVVIADFPKTDRSRLDYV